MLSISKLLLCLYVERATCSQNQCPDTAAIDAFCGLINKEPESAQMATRFITAKVHSLQEWEALQALNVSTNPMYIIPLIVFFTVIKTKIRPTWL